MLKWKECAERSERNDEAAKSFDRMVKEKGTVAKKQGTVESLHRALSMFEPKPETSAI
jgi:hypothetical protein